MKSILFLVLFISTFANANFQKTKILPLGDSLTAGGYNLNKTWYIDGGYREHLWNSLTAANFDFEFVGSLKHGKFANPEHEGHSGYRIEEVAALTEKALSTHQPDVILLILGSNDLFQNYDIDSAHLRFLELVERILNFSPNAKLFVGSPIITNNLILNQRVKSYSKKIQSGVLELQKNYPQLHWVDMLNKSKITKDDLTDGVHPTRLGYEKMAKVWFEALEAHLPVALAPIGE